MKLLREEDGKAVAYVQVRDIRFLENAMGVKIPKVAKEELEQYDLRGCSEYTLEFARFEEAESVEYFRNNQVIIEYDQYRDYSPNQFFKEMETITAEMTKNGKRWVDLEPEEKLDSEKENILNQYLALEYRFKSILELLVMRH